MSWGEALRFVLIVWPVVSVGVGGIYAAWRYKRRKR